MVDAEPEPRSFEDSKPLESPSPSGRNHDGLTALLGQDSDVEIQELDKSGNVTQTWLHTPSNDIRLVPSQGKSNNIFFRSMREWRKGLYDAFLPVGFPHSVSDDYLGYQTFDSLQAFFSTITSLLANRALLQGLGVGDANSSATFAMLLTILKDTMARVATIVFAQQFGLRIEPDAKKFRFLADLFNDTAFFLELYSPYFGSLGKVMALGTGEALRALCGVSAGASKAALSVHFAKHDNLAELNAKEASQETAVGLVGLLVGSILVKCVEDHQSVVYLMVGLVFAHLWMNYLGVRCVCMTSLNRQRATILFNEYLKTGNVLSPEEVAERESIIFWHPMVRNKMGKRVAKIEMAESYGNAMGEKHPCGQIDIVDGSFFSLFVWSPGNKLITPIKILLWKDAEPIHIIMAWFMAMEMAWEMDEGEGYSPRLDRVFVGDKTGTTPGIEKDGAADENEEKSVDEYQKRYNSRQLWEAIRAKGWNLDAQGFETGAPIRLVAQSREKKNQ